MDAGVYLTGAEQASDLSPPGLTAGVGL